MSHKENIHNKIQEIADEIYTFIKQQEPFHEEGWVPAHFIKKSLDLNFVAVPKSGKQYGEKGWLFATIGRILEDQEKIKHDKKGNRAFYKTL